MDGIAQYKPPQPSPVKKKKRKQHRQNENDRKREKKKGNPIKCTDKIEVQREW